VLSAAVVRALGGLRSRPGATLAAAAGLVLAGVLAGTATTTGIALATGFDRAQRAAGTADVIARFDEVERDAAAARLSPLANVRSISYRIVVRPVDLAAFADGEVQFGTAEVNGVELEHADDGLALVAGRGLSGAPGEAVVERGLANEWGLEPGDPLRLADWVGRVVGVAVEPDNVAFPLAARPRVYLLDSDVRGDILRTGATAVNAAYLHLIAPDRLPETLVQARAASYGVTGLTFTTRAGVRALVDEAGGLVGGLLIAFAVVALLAAGAMLAAAGHARVTAEVGTIGALRALGFAPLGLAASYAIEAMLVALPAAAIGVTLGAFLVRGATADLLGGLNELAPPGPLWPAHAAAIAVIALLAGLAAGWPAFAAARRPVVATLRGRVVAPPRGPAATARPIVVGARLALARPGRLAVSAIAVAAAVATILLLLALARFLIDAQREPSAIGERYSLVARGRDALELARGTPGVAAAAERLQVRGVDGFDLAEPLTLVAFGPGGESVFAGRPLLEGRRARARNEVEVGRGLAQSLGLAPGGRLLALLEGGSEVRLRVTGVVQELGSDGRVAYTSLAALRAAAPGERPEVAVRAASGVAIAELADRLEARGLRVQRNAGLAPAGAPFVDTIVALLRVVALVTGLVCGAIVLLSLLVLARERAETIGIMRAAGARPAQIMALLTGASLALLAIALPLAYLLERVLFGPLVSGLVERYGALPLVPAPLDLALVVAAFLVVALLTAAATGRRLSRLAIVDLLRDV